MTNVFMRIPSRLTGGLPVHAWLGDRLVRAGFVHAPHGQTHAFPLGVGLLDQPFFALASGSWTLTSPRLRLRTTSPVWHQVRSRCQLIPASCSTAQIVYVLMLARPSGARRKARCKVFNDQVDAVNALKNKQVDAIVVDLPTAFYVTAAQVPNSVIAGQLPASGTTEQFGMLFQKGNSLVTCVNQALSQVKSSGELARIQQQWITSAGAPVLK